MIQQYLMTKIGRHWWKKDKLLLFHPEMFSAQFFWGNVFLRRAIKRCKKIQILKLSRVTFYMNSESMPQRKFCLPDKILQQWTEILDSHFGVLSNCARKTYRHGSVNTSFIWYCKCSILLWFSHKYQGPAHHLQV